MIHLAWLIASFVVVWLLYRWAHRDFYVSAANIEVIHKPWRPWLRMAFTGISAVFLFGLQALALGRRWLQ